MKKPTISSSGAATLALLLIALWPAAAAAEEHMVTVMDTIFTPDELDIQVGDTVTWTNTGGVHNVDADDGSFTSGPVSGDAWVFSQTFHEGGVVTYHCDNHPVLMTGTINIEGIFGDPFESGDSGAWSISQPVTPSCNCYFNGDCVGGEFCNWGSLPVQDSCIWRENKPEGVPGAGCDLPHAGPWGLGICDGVCAPSSLGSLLGWEDETLIDEGIRIWAEAILGPAVAGGGPVDPVLAQRALELKLKSPTAAITLGRHVADLLAFAGSPGFAQHFCHFEGHPGDPDPGLFVDLSDDPCRRAAAWSAVEALIAELDVAGSCAKIVSGIALSCPDWREMFGPRCTGDDALSCVEQRIFDLGVFLGTPRSFGGVPPIFATPSSDAP